MKLFRIFLTIALLIAGFTWFTQSAAWKRAKAIHRIHTKTNYKAGPDIKQKLADKAVSAKIFVKDKKINEQYCFLIDMDLPSGQKRFFIYDLKADSVLSSGLVTHGNCFENWLEGKRYSNVVGSGCTSLGKYKTGSSYTGKWGYSYKLHGLDSSNNNAFERTVVLHGHRCVSEIEVEDEICQSNGCPTVSPAFLEQLKGIINNSKKPVLLWIYE
jgi:hypothetical protein